MRTVKMIAGATLLLLPILAFGADICVWNYDTLDRYYDPEVGDSVDCSYRVEQVLAAQGHNVEVHNTYLPANLAGYDLVFCLMGWYRC